MRSLLKRHTWQHVLLIGIVLVVVGCGTSRSTSSTTLTPTPNATPTTYVAPMPCLSPPPDVCRFWVPNVIAASVVLAQPTAESNLAQLVAATLNHVAGTTLAPYQASTNAPPVIALNTTATVFLQNTSTTDDVALLTIIDKINGLLSSPTPTGAPAQGFIAVNQSKDWIVGASPDWFGTPAQSGGDHVHGSPDDPPAPTTPSMAAISPSVTPSAAGKTVYVLDTGYLDASQLPSDGHFPAFDNLKLLWQQDALPFSLASDAYSAPALIPPYEFDQEDPTIAAMSPAPAYSPDHYRAVNVQDHGLAISELIHWDAPTAHIHLIRVLNDYGVGDLQDLLAGIQMVLQQGQKGAIVNLSLDYGPPTDCLDQYWNAAKTSSTLNADSGAARLGQVFGTNGCLTNDGGIANNARRYIVIGLAIQELLQMGDIVVASAGNSSSGGTHGDANMPAAYCGVVAAAATDGMGNLAPFSNKANSPCIQFPPLSEQSGSFLLATNSKPLWAQTLGMKVCSLHFQKLLPYDANAPSNGLALWSGTSFAAALVSGNIAANPSIVPGSAGNVVIANQSVPCK